MDPKNRYHTEGAYLHERLEHVTLVIVCSLLTLLHLDQVSWWRFVAAFGLVDLIGYLPGAVAFRRGGGSRIAPLYHHLYNITHSYLTAALIIGAWALAAGGFEWAMLALPIHLSGDRGLFGNIFKPTALYFEPIGTVSHPGVKQAELGET